MPADTAVLAPSLSPEPILAPTPGALLRKRIFGHGGFVIGATALTLIVLMALLAPLISPHDPYDQDLGRRLIPPRPATRRAFHATRSPATTRAQHFGSR